MLISRISASFVRRKPGFRLLFYSGLALTFISLAVFTWQHSSRAAQHPARAEWARWARGVGSASSSAGVKGRPAKYRSPGGRHKLRVRDKQLAAELQKQGALLVAEYDAFQILS